MKPAVAPDAAQGVFETLLVRAGRAFHVEQHLERLAASTSALYGLPLPADLGARVSCEAERSRAAARIRVVVAPPANVTVALGPLPSNAPVVLRPVVIEGGLGEHKWRDRRLIEGLSTTDHVPLIVDRDGEVLEAAHASLFAVVGETLVTPPLDGRLLPGTARARLIASARRAGRSVREEPLSVERLARADAILLTSALRGAHRASLDAAFS